MSEITTVYPTSGLADRSFGSIMTALYNYINTIPAVTDFFDSVVKIGETQASYTDHKMNLTKGQSVLKIAFDDSNGSLVFNNNPTISGINYKSNITAGTKTYDISVSFATGRNGTAAVWLDDLNNGICMVFGEFDDKIFVASSIAQETKSLYYTDSGTAVKELTSPFNGSNIGRGTDYIAQPYYHLGINTGDIYTFDGGGSDIPWGRFNLDNAEFVRLTSNFALRL